MSTIAVVYHSGFGHTQALAEAVAKGAESVSNTKVSLIPVAEAEARQAELDGADAIIFGSPTYMGGVSAEFAKFKDWTSKRWMEGAWRNKLAAGFTASASWNGDKHNTLYQLLTLALQHGMVWVGLGQGLRMAEARVIDYGDGAHDSLQSFDSTREKDDLFL